VYGGLAAGASGVEIASVPHDKIKPLGR
jgi:hypothetical protein